MKNASLVLAVALLGLPVAASAQPADAEMKKLIAEYSAAWAKGDAAAVAAQYAEDAVSVNDTGILQGRTAVQQRLATLFAGPYKGTTIAITAEATRSIGPDVAVSAGTYTVSGLKGADGKELPPARGRYLNTIVRKGGHWLIAGNAPIAAAPAK